MRCLKCGRELMEEELFCPDCGTKAGEAGSVELTLDWEELRAAWGSEKIRGVWSEWTKRLGAARIPYLAGLALLVVTLFAANCEMVSLTYYTKYTAREIRISMLEGMDQIRFVFYIAYVAGIIIMALPLFTGKSRAWRRRDFILGIVTPAAAALWLAIVRFGAESVVNQTMSADFLRGYSDLEIRLAGGEWFFLIASLAAFWMVYDAKKWLT